MSEACEMYVKTVQACEVCFRNKIMSRSNVSHACEFPIYYVNLEVYFRTSNLACETMCENGTCMFWYCMKKSHVETTARVYTLISMLSIPSNSKNCIQVVHCLIADSYYINMMVQYYYKYQQCGHNFHQFAGVDVIIMTTRLINCSIFCSSLVVK